MNKEPEWTALEKPADWPENIPWLDIHYNANMTTCHADPHLYYWHDPNAGFFQRLADRIQDWKRGVDYYGRYRQPGLDYYRRPIKHPK